MCNMVVLQDKPRHDASGSQGPVGEVLPSSITSAYEEVKHRLQDTATEEGMGIAECSPQSAKIVYVKL